MTAEALPDHPTAGGPQPSPRRRVAAAVLALLFLNGMLSFKEWWPTPGVLPDHRLAPEFVWLWLALLAAVGLAGPLSRRAVAGFTLVYMLLVVGRYADVTAPSLFGRPINLYWDGAQIPRFLWVSAQDLAWWQSGAVLAAVLLMFWVLYRLLRLAMAVTAQEAVPYALRRPWVWGLTAAAVVLATANYAGVQATWPVVSKPVIPTYWRQAKLLAAAFSPRQLAEVLPPSATLETALAAPTGAALGALAGRDLYLMPLESYGAIAYDHPEAARRLAPFRAQLAADIAESGRQVVSAFVRSPTFAGGSDLAHLSLLSGLDLSDPLRHDVLLTTDRPTLMTLFRAQGYETIGLYPALSWDWPERAFYGFDTFLEGRSLDYRGPVLGYWHIPDQFTLARFEQLQPRGADVPPRFLFFPTITCHLPFSQVPPYQPDWQRVLTADPYDPEPLKSALAEEPDWLNMFPDYVRMMEYSYRWLGGFLRQPEPRETVFVLVGDHQPAANVSGEGASWDVPVHIVARDPELLERFVRLGFHPGLDPPRAPLGEVPRPDRHAAGRLLPGRTGYPNRRGGPGQSHGRRRPGAAGGYPLMSPLRSRPRRALASLTPLGLVLAALALAGLARYRLVEPADLTAACDAASWEGAICTLRTLTVQAFAAQRLGLAAMACALLALVTRWRWAALTALALGSAGLVLYSVGWAAPAVLIAALVLVRPGGESGSFQQVPVER